MAYEEVSAPTSEGVDVLVSKLAEEEASELGLHREAEEWEAGAIEFLDLPIPDRSVHQTRMIFCEALMGWLKWCDKDDCVGVHCRASIRRSSLLAVSVLVRLGWNTKEAFDAVESARGSRFQTPQQREW